EFSHGDIVARGGPTAWNAVTFYAYRNADDMGGDMLAASSYRVWGFKDFDCSDLPSSYHRTREGAERFLITDINNPAAGAKAQSTVPIMFDAWANNTNDWSVSNLDQQAIARFNHLPGGSNVLYMDGHVEFVRFPTKFPVY